MKRAIISGATGAIGTALVKKLVEHGAEVLVLMRPGSARSSNILSDSHVKVVGCGLGDYASFDICKCLNFESEIANENFDVFYHFAWAGTTGDARNDMYLQNNNVRYALDAVAMAKRFGCKVFIGAGSQAEYGRVSGVLKSDTKANPEMGYGYAKLCAGYMTRDYAHQLGLAHIWTRILSVYGPNDGAQSMVMSTIEKLKRGETPQFTKGEQLWDYLYSDDAAEAFYLLGEKALSYNSSNGLSSDLSANEIDGKTYVIGSGSVKPLSEYIETIRDVVSPGATLDMGTIPYAPKQVMHLQADITELSADTGWQAKTKFDDGIRKIIETL